MLLTDKGEFSGFATLRHAYIDAYEGNPPIECYFNADPWEEDKLHISDLGKCPRMQMLRLNHAPKKKRDAETLANEALMFMQGNWIHALTVGAADWAGILITYEQELPGLPPGWTGHYDMIWDNRLANMAVAWDGKSVRPNAFNYAYTWPKLPNKLQMQGYLKYLTEVAYGDVEYIDRGGSNPPQLFEITRDNEAVENIMFDLEMWNADRTRRIGPILPPVLEPTYTVSYTKVRNELVHRISSVFYGPQWDCEWCDYLHGVQDKKTKSWYVSDKSPCRPEMPTKVAVAKYLKGKLVILEDGHEAAAQWVETQLPEWTEEPSVFDEE